MNTPGGMNSERTEQHVEGTHAVNVDSGESMRQNRAAWIDMFVQEMMNASDWDDVRGRAMKFLEAFERNVVENATASAEVDNLISLEAYVHDSVCPCKFAYLHISPVKYEISYIFLEGAFSCKMDPFALFSTFVSFFFV